MANQHFANLADVWKHLPLAEVLSIERPKHYWESHAGNAEYALVDNPERRYGAVRFLEVERTHPALARSRYLAHLRSLDRSPGGRTYPSSPLLAMLERGGDCDYLFATSTPPPRRTLRSRPPGWASSPGPESRPTDGVTTLHDALAAAEQTDTILAHVDPYDPRAPGLSGLSAARSSPPTRVT